MSVSPAAIIGLGAIGGSLARALKAKDVPARAWGRAAKDGDLAREAGIDVGGDLADTVTGAAIVVIAVPLPALPDVVADVIEAAPANAIIIHTAGLQRLEAIGLPPEHHARVLGTHPLAGSADSGFGAARADMFHGCRVSVELRPEVGASPAAEAIWRTVGAQHFDFRDAVMHDTLMVWTSHLPQLTATALASTFVARRAAPRLAGPGARDTTRLAASSYQLWSPMLAAAPAGELDVALAALEERIGELRRLIAARDFEGLATFWEPARTWRRDAEEGV